MAVAVVTKEEDIMEEVMAVQESYLKSVTCWP